MRNKNNNKEVGGQAKKNVSNSFVLPHQHMVAMTSDENALWLPQVHAGNLFTELQDLIPSWFTPNVGMSEFDCLIMYHGSRGSPPTYMKRRCDWL